MLLGITLLDAELRKWKEDGKRKPLTVINTTSNGAWMPPTDFYTHLHNPEPTSFYFWIISSCTVRKRMRARERERERNLSGAKRGEERERKRERERE